MGFGAVDALVIDHRDFNAATTEIRYEPFLLPEPYPAADREMNQPRLFRPGNRLDCKAGFLACAIHEHVAVAALTHGAGGNGAMNADLQLFETASKRFEGVGRGF